MVSADFGEVKTIVNTKPAVVIYAINVKKVLFYRPRCNAVRLSPQKKDVVFVTAVCEHSVSDCQK
jgi:hypothetical protein